ncbi:MAG: RidA family protein [Betaproteobacteria bacterium]|nr:RidA family protein [Betaproteobacteria bacterium]
MERKFINPEGMVKPGAYTPAISVTGGRTIYISGQVSQDGEGNIVGKGDLLAQTEQVYKNLVMTFAASGASFNDVVKLNVYVVGYKPENRAQLQSVREKYVNKENPPASTLIGVQALARAEFLVEVEAVAVVG